MVTAFVPSRFCRSRTVRPRTILNAGGDPSAWGHSTFQNLEPRLLLSGDTTGEIFLLDDQGAETFAYDSSSSTARIRVVDADANTGSSTLESLTVQITSTTEAGGTYAYATAPVAGASNVGNGLIKVDRVGFQAKAQTWTLIVKEVAPLIMSVEGSVSGAQADFSSKTGVYDSKDEHFQFHAELGDIDFAVGDEFEFEIKAPTLLNESLVIQETGTNTGVFEGTIPLGRGAAAVAADGVLQVGMGDDVYAIYNDPKGDFGAPGQDLSKAVMVNSVIPGALIDSDTTWTKADSPYYLTGDVTVNSGVVLTIEAGVEVLVLPGGDVLGSGGNSNRVELRVFGGLDVNGTEHNEVRFDSISATPEGGDWQGLYFSSQGTGDLQHSIIGHAEKPVQFYSSAPPNGVGLSIRNSIIHDSADSGIRSYGSSGCISISVRLCGLVDGVWELIADVDETVFLDLFRPRSADPFEEVIPVAIEFDTA